MRRKGLVLTGFILVMGMITACGTSADSQTADGKNEREEMRALFYHEETVVEPGHYMIDGVELSEAAEVTQDADDRWEGYTETELGFLTPEKMPNCITDETGNHWVLYDNVMYAYVNDFNLKDGDASPFKEYANVWCSMDSENRRVLGDLEEYGRMCAQEE